MLSKFKSDSQTIFPMISIKSIEKMPSFKEDNELLDAIKAQIFFRNEYKKLLFSLKLF